MICQDILFALIKEKIPPTPKRGKRCLPGMKPCHEPNCETCPFVTQTKQFRGPFNNVEVKINGPINCHTSNVVYCLQCNKSNCRQIYVGHTQRQLKERFGEHKNSVKNKTKNAIGDHFNGPGHSVSDMKVLALEKVYKPGLSIIEKRESLWINRLEAEFRGLNRKK